MEDKAVDLAYLRAHPQHLPTFLTHQRIRETPVSGGDVCVAARLTLDDGASIFAKTWPGGTPPEGFFASEAAGLRWLVAQAPARRINPSDNPRLVPLAKVPLFAISAVQNHGANLRYPGEKIRLFGQVDRAGGRH